VEEQGKLEPGEGPHGDVVVEHYWAFVPAEKHILIKPISNSKIKRTNRIKHRNPTTIHHTQEHQIENIAVPISHIILKIGICVLVIRLRQLFGVPFVAGAAAIAAAE
jgi:hypothetical protein